MGTTPRHACESVVYCVASPKAERDGIQLGAWSLYQREYAPIQQGVLWIPTCGYEEASADLTNSTTSTKGLSGATAHLPEQWWLFSDKARFKPQARKWPIDHPYPRLSGKLNEAITEFWQVGWIPVDGKTYAYD